MAFERGLSPALIKRIIEEGYEDTLTIITSYPMSKVRKDGKILLFLLKIGLNPIDIDQLVDIRAITIERRILNFLKEKEENGEDTYDDYKFIFEKVKGLPTVDIYRRYLYSKISEKDFLKVELISGERLRTIKKEMNSKGMKRYEDELRLEREKKDAKYKNSVNYEKGKRKKTYSRHVIKLA